MEATDLNQLVIRVNDRMLDLEQDVTITSKGKVLFSGHVKRSIATVAKTIAERGDPKSIFSGEVVVTLNDGPKSD